MSSLLRTRTVSRSIKSAWDMVLPSQFLVEEGEDCLLPMAIDCIVELRFKLIVLLPNKEHKLGTFISGAAGGRVQKEQRCVWRRWLLLN